ncbi:hypothetical protein [Lysinibacillus sp. 54212]|uniref:hypothetical protein n=1 Tax=Lysinibacillus sp. 54212 TaxID=3119829 RepID=UPI002FC9E382
MNRAERRRRERGARKYDQVQTFTKSEAEAMSEQSYRYGVAFALLAAKEVLQLGDVRLDRVRKKIIEYEFEHFQQLKPFNHDMNEIIEYKGVAQRGK